VDWIHLTHQSGWVKWVHEAKLLKVNSDSCPTHYF
jgi:hypothetical protein